jgi:polyhydroxyalkanoate synthesis regulator phasin
MATTKASKRGQASILPLGDLRARVDQLRKEVESIGKRAAEILPKEQRKQVDGVIDRITSVRDDVNKAVETWRTDFERRFKVVRGTVDKRVTTLRKQTQSNGKRLLDGVEKETRRYIERMFKQLKLPVRGDLDALKRRVAALERRLEELEKSDKRAA